MSLQQNAAKYGALSVTTSRVLVDWTIVADGPGRLELIWAEQNGPHIGGLPSDGFRRERIERGIRYELQG